MSRIGAKSIAVPEGVTVEVKAGTVHVKGSKGELTYALLPEVSVGIDAGVITVKRILDNGEAKARHGLTRALLVNMIAGVAGGHERKLEIVGVGFKAVQKGK